MTDCTATLTTQTVTNRMVAKIRCTSEKNHPGHFRGAAVSDGMQVKRVGDRLLEVTVHTLTCEDPVPHGPRHYNEQHDLDWHDGWPGATPHADPAPDDEMIRHGFWPSASDKNICGRKGCATRRSHPIHLDSDPDPCPDCDDEGGAMEDTIVGPQWVPCPSCGGSGTRPADTDAAADALCKYREHVAPEPNDMTSSGISWREGSCLCHHDAAVVLQAAARARQEQP